MAPQKGDVVWLDFDMEVEGVDGVFDTTRKEVAEKHGIHDASVRYQPVIAVLGAGRLVPGLDEAIQGAEVGKETRVELPPEKAFGQRDAKHLEVVPAQEFKKAKVKAEPGHRITYKDRPATIQRVAGGRVWLDLNPPLAGKAVTYTFVVRRVADKPEEKAEALVRAHYDPNQPLRVTYHEEEHTIDVVPPAPAVYDERWLMAKFRIVNDFIKFTDFERVRFIEEFATKVPKDLLAKDATGAQGDEATGRTEGSAPEAEKAA